MKNIILYPLVLLFLLTVSCSKENSPEPDNTMFSDIRQITEAAIILSQFNTSAAAQVNVVLGGHLNFETRNHFVEVRSVFSSPEGPNVDGDISLDPFGLIPVDEASNKVYRLNIGINRQEHTGSGYYSLAYEANNPHFSDVNTTAYLDFDFDVSTEDLELIEAVEYLDKTSDIDFNWEPLSGAEANTFVYVGICAEGSNCFYAQIPDNGSYTIGKEHYANLASGQKVHIAFARGSQKCIPSADKEFCITSFCWEQLGEARIK